MWKQLLCATILAHASFSVWAASATADSYPSRTIRLILGFPPGGGDDYVARLIAPKLTERIGQTVIVDNRPGASSNVGAEMVARANPDGYTLFLGSSTALTSSRSLYPKLGYDLLKDFSYVSRVATGAYVLLAHPSMPVKSVSELVALARSKPKAIRYGSAGVGSSNHIAMELLLSQTGMELLHVPYRGGGPAIIGLLGGEVGIEFATTSGATPLIKAKRLNVLAVSSAKRIGTLPEVPTVAESGYPGFDAATMYGILAPTGTPAAVVKLLNAEIRNIVQMEDVRAKLAELGFEAAGSTPDEFRAIMEAEAARLARVIKDARISVD